MSIQNCQHQNSPTPERELVQKVRELEEQVEKLKRAKKLKSKEYDPNLISEPLRKFMDSNVLAMNIAGLDGRLYELNEAGAKIIGYNRDDLENGTVNWHSITPPEHRAVDIRAIEELRQTGRTSQFRKEYIRPDGSRQAVLIAANFINVEAELCMAYTLDMSETRRVEKELQKSEQRLKSLADALPAIVWITDEKGRAVYSNQRFYEFSGFDREQPDPFRWISLIHPDERDGYLEYAREMSKQRAPFEREARWRAADGSYRWQLIRGVPAYEEGSDTPRWFGTCTDVDDQHKATDEIRESEARYRILADAIPQVVFTTDRHGRIEYYNQRWSDLSGLPPGSSCEDAWRFLIHPEDLERYLEGWKRALRTGDSYECEFRLKPVPDREQPGDGDFKHYLARAVALRDKEGNVNEWFATWTEIAKENFEQ